jgi:hypothetical protein
MSRLTGTGAGSLADAYASIYEGYGKKKEEKKGEDCTAASEKTEHNCAKKVCHEEFGEGTCVYGQHAVPDRHGFVSHYDVQFSHGIEKGVPVSEMKVLEEGDHPTAEGHEGMYDGEQLDEQDGTGREVTRRAQERTRVERDRLIQQAGGGAAGEAQRRAGKEAQLNKEIPPGSFMWNRDRIARSDAALDRDARYRTRQTGEANLRRLGGGDLNKGLEIFRKQQADAKPTKPTEPTKPKPKPSQVVLAKKGGVEGKLDKATGKFTASNFSDAERSRYVSRGGSSSSSTQPAKPAAKPIPTGKTPGGTSFERRTPTSTELAAAQKAGGGEAGVKAAVAVSKPAPLGSALGSAADPKVRSALNLPSKPAPAKVEPEKANILGNKKSELAALQAKAKAETLKGKLNNSTDLFDLVKGHLIDEGASEEEVMKIMVSMTQEEILAFAEGYDEPKMHAAAKRVMQTQGRPKGMAASALHSKYSMRSKGNIAGETDGPGPNAPKRSGRKGRGAETDRGSGNKAKRRMDK